MDTLNPDVLALLWLVALLAGTIDAIAGGGGLLTVPSLLWAGVPPVATLATNKLQGSFGSLSASVHFVRQGQVRLRPMIWMITLTFCGSALGSLAVQFLANELLQQIIPILLILLAIYLLFSPRVGDLDSHQRIGEPLFALLVGFGVGAYDGFFGPGAGSFYAIGFVSLLGFHMTKATAHSKILNFTSNLAALLFFAASGHVWWIVGLVMGTGQMLGAWLGAHLVIKKGARLVRPALVTISVVIALKLLLSN